MIMGYAYCFNLFNKYFVICIPKLLLEVNICDLEYPCKSVNKNVSMGKLVIFQPEYCQFSLLLEFLAGTVFRPITSSFLYCPIFALLSAIF